MSEPAVKTPPSHQEVFEKQQRSERTTGQVVVSAKPEEKIEEKAPVEVVIESKVEKPEEKAPVEVAAKPDLDSLSDEELEEYLAKRTGNKEVSLKKLQPAPKELTAEEKEELRKQEEADSFAWALANNKIDKNFYDKSISDKAKGKREIALALFTADAQAEDKNLTDEDCAQMFSDYYAEEEPEDSWKRKKALKEMNSVADNYLNQYKVIDEIPDSYRAERTDAEAQKTYNETISAIAKEIPSELTFPIQYESIDGTKSTLQYTIPVDPKIIESLTREFTKGDMFKALGNSKPEQISGEMNYHVKARMMDSIIAQITEKHAEKVLEDAMVNIKNAKSPIAPFGSKQIESTKLKAPPSHEDVLRRVK